MLGQPAAARQARRDATGSASPTTQLRAIHRGRSPRSRRTASSRSEPLQAAARARTRGMSPVEFEQEVRQELLLAPLQEPIVAANIVARSIVERYLTCSSSSAKSRSRAIDAEPFVKEVKIDDAAVKAFYDSNQAAFQTPEQAKIEYVVLTPDALARADQRRPGRGQKAVRRQPEGSTRSRRSAQASHILIAVKPDASDDEKAAAKKKADEVCRAGEGESGASSPISPRSIRRTRARRSRAAISELRRAARWSNRSRTPCSRSSPARSPAGPDRLRLAHHQGQRRAPGEGTQPFDEVKAQIEPDLKRQKASAEVRRRRPISSRTWSTSRRTRWSRRGQGARPQGRDDAARDARAGPGARARQRRSSCRRCSRPNRLQAQAQHRGDRGRRRTR